MFLGVLAQHLDLLNLEDIFVLIMQNIVIRPVKF